MRSWSRALGAVGVALATIFAGQGAHAAVADAPPEINPSAVIYNAGYNSRGGGVGSSYANVYMNRNQLVLRITGCEFDARVTQLVDGTLTKNAPNDGFCDNGAGNARQWLGSGMGFVEEIVNEKLLGAVTYPAQLPGYNPAIHTHLNPSGEPLFRNYVDLLFKRFLDGEKLTAIDYDPQTFRMVDIFNPSTTTPTGLDCVGSLTPTTIDTNCDGVSGGWELQSLGDALGNVPLLAGCLALPIIGDVCFNTYFVNVTDKVAFYPYAPTYVAPSNPVPTGTLVNNIAAPMLDFRIYDPSDQANSSHLFLASKPNRDYTFDAEISGCDQAVLLSDAGSGNSCNRNPYRDDDDGLYAELQLSDFQIQMLFEPPFTTSVYATSNETDRLDTNGLLLAGNEFRHRVTMNIQDIPETGSGAQWWPCPDGSAIYVTSEASDGYDPACDLSRYLKATGVAEVPVLRIGASIRLASAYGYNATQAGPAVTNAPSVIIGVELQELVLDAQFQFAFWSGPYCTSSLQGQDFIGIFYDRTDIPSNCASLASGATWPTAFDDATYLVSEQFTAFLPWFRAELAGVFQDLFDPTTNPGWFLGPTQLVDVATLLPAPLLSWPLAATHPTYVTNNVWAELMLDSSVDTVDVLPDLAAADGTEYGLKYNPGDSLQGDNVNEFWADPWGVLLPMSAGMGLYWTQDTAATVEMVSCVTADASFTGYVDGYATGPGNDPNDDPYVSRPLPRLNMNWSGSPKTLGWPAIHPNATADPATNVASYDSLLLHLKIPDVNGAEPFTQPSALAAATAVVPNLQSGLETYAFGLAVHQNMLSKLLYEAVIDGLLCLDIDPVGTNVDFFKSLDSFLTTDTLGFFVPYLADKYPGMPMAIRVIPLLQDPQGGLYAKSAASYPSAISEFIGDFSNGGTQPTASWQRNPIPRIVTGGINVYDELKRRFVGEIKTRSLQNGLWPDLSVIIPHLLVEFYVWDKSSSPWVRKRAFALDLGINVGINIDIIQDIQLGSQVATPLEQGGFPLNRPLYSGTDFPIGCRRTTAQDPVNGDDSFPYPCEVTGVPSRLVLFLGGLLDPELNAILVYDEMASQITDFTGAVSDVSQSADPSGTGDPAQGYSGYEDAISNLLGLILSGELSAVAEIGIDPAALLNLPIVITVPYIGPSFVWNDESAATPGSGVNAAVAGYSNNELDDSVGCGAWNGVANTGNCKDPVFATPTNPIQRDVSDNDVNGFGDYLVIAAGLDLSYMSSNYLLRFLDSFLEPGSLVSTFGYTYCSGKDADGNPATDITCVSESFNNSLLSLVSGGGLGFAPEAIYNTNQGFPRGYVSPETIIKGVRKAHALETIIEFEGWHPTVPAEQLTFSYRVDGGLWTPFVHAKAARIPGLLEGRHVFEVRAKDPAGNVEYTPERIEFVVDSVAPKVWLVGDRVQSGTATFLVDVRDAQTLPEDVRISYKVDDGAWSPYSYDKELRLDVAPGQHTLTVRAMDEAGNVGETVLTFAVEEGGFGCSVAQGGASGLLDLLVVLLAPAIVLWRRRRLA